MIKQIDDRTILLFGHGSLSIGIAHNTKTLKDDVLTIYEIEEGDLNRIISKDVGKKTDEVGKIVEMRFTKTESIDILIKKLQEIKRNICETL